MNKIILSTAVISLLGTSLFAGPKFEVTPIVGKKLYNYSDDAPRFDDGEALIGGKINAYVKNRVSIQLAAETSKENGMGTGIPTANNGAWTDLMRGMLNVQYDMPAKGKVTPYALVGMGYEKLDRAEASTNVDSQAFYNGGAGVRYSVNDKIDLVAETRVIHKVEDQDTDLIGTVGVGFKFGEKEQAALSLADLAKRTPTTPPVVVSHVAAPVAPAPEVISSRIEYDSGSLELCCGDKEAADVSSSCPSDRDTASEISGYYVQVIALRKNSPDVISARLDAKGYNYTYQEAGDITRVLVGPYENRAAANSALRGLKNIRRDAFIYHAK